MDNRERLKAVLHYGSWDRLPLIHFGYWVETLLRWAAEGHITEDEARGWADGNAIDTRIALKLGFDLNWAAAYSPNPELFPRFEPLVLETMPDGSRRFLDEEGVIVIQRDDATSIPMELGHTFTGRHSWETEYVPRLTFSEQRISASTVPWEGASFRFDEGGSSVLKDAGRGGKPIGIYCGSLIGRIRNIVGLVELSYLSVDDPSLLDEMIDVFGTLSYSCVKTVLEAGCIFDFAHFWEDICGKNGPLVHPDILVRKVALHYRRITDMLRSHGVDIVSLDCDGEIDRLIPIWLENGVNTMFPIEIGTWKADFGKWRRIYGKELRGVGGMDKTAFARDGRAIDAEIERLKPLVDMGGYIPCPDHRLAPDAKWDLVRYYCDRMRQTFG